ncbi:MAG TPA: hypothetical protein VM450_19500 [Thermomicrobiales bacterium]|nr:hypothetical protein [Thermomicrobiales bacterium]
MDNAARDGFATYFTERLWEMIPETYRHEDGLASNPGVLRALVETLAAQAAIVRRSHDKVWDDAFIDLCDDWAIPYLADLLGTRLVSVLNPRGRRIDVAKTIYYRRRKGTPRVLEELISDISEWEGVVVETFRRLGRHRHGLDPAPLPLAGRLSGTLPGGWADLRRADAAALAGGPFDEYHHTPDGRRHRGADGRYAIPKVAFHLYRLASHRVEEAFAKPRPDGLSFSVDPSGRDIPLFMPRSRPADYDAWHAAREWEVPGPIACRLLGDAAYQIGEATVQALVDDEGLSTPAADDLRGVRDIRFASESRLRETVASFANAAEILAAPMFAALLRLALVPECGKAALLPNAVSIEEEPGVGVPVESIAAGNLQGWAANAPGKRLVIDPQRGRLLFLGAAPAGPVRVTFHYGFSGAFGATTSPLRPIDPAAPDARRQGGGPLSAPDILANGVTEIGDSATYGPIANKLSVANLTLRAADMQRPFLRLNANWILNTGAGIDALLGLDGLWMGGSGEVVLRGDFERVTIRSCTLDPGGLDRDGGVVAAVPLVIEAQVRHLAIERSITGPIRVQGNGLVQSLEITDSIVQSRDAAVPALTLGDGIVVLRRVTVLGAIDVHRLDASEALITGVGDVTDTQAGCFRFSAAPAGSRLPHPYESHVLDDQDPLFTSRRFGAPGYGQLSDAAPAAVRRGAENGSEIGAFSSLMNPIRFDGLQAKVDEYLPFGLIPIYLPET